MPDPPKNKPQSQPDWPPDAPAGSGGSEGGREGGRGSISTLGRRAKLSRHRRLHAAAPQTCRHHSSNSRSASPAPRRDGALSRAGEQCGGERCGGRERWCGQGGSGSFLLKLPRCCLALVPTASPSRAAPCPPGPRTPKGPLGPPRRPQMGKEAGDGARARTPPAWSPATVRRGTPSPPAPRAPPPQAAPGRALGAPPAGAALLGIWQRAPLEQIFSSPRVLENFLPTEALCKGEKIVKGRMEKIRA